MYQGELRLRIVENVVGWRDHARSSLPIRQLVVRILKCQLFCLLFVIEFPISLEHLNIFRARISFALVRAKVTMLLVPGKVHGLPFLVEILFQVVPCAVKLD
jgi:hypothetical protein